MCGRTWKIVIVSVCRLTIPDAALRKIIYVLYLYVMLFYVYCIFKCI